MLRAQVSQNWTKIFFRVNYGGLTGFFVAVGLVYFVLLEPKSSWFSIARMIHWVNHASSELQALLILMIPIYISLLIFGGASLGWWLGKRFNRLFYQK